MSRCKNRWSHGTISQFLNEKEKFKLHKINTNKIKTKRKKILLLSQSDRATALHMEWSIHCTSASDDSGVTSSSSCVQQLSTIICWGFVLNTRSREPAVASLIILLMCGHSGFTPLLLAQSRALERSEVQLENRNLRAAEAPQRSNQWAIRFPLIYLAWLDVDANQSHISVMVFPLIASPRSGCIPFRLWSLSANEVRKAYGSCSQPVSTES